MVSTVIALIFPFGMICLMFFFYRGAENPSIIGRVLGIAAVVVSIGIPVSNIFITRRMIAQLKSPGITKTFGFREHLYCSDTAVFVYFFLLLLAFTYFCYKLYRMGTLPNDVN